MEQLTQLQKKQKYDAEENGEPKSKDNNDKNDDASNFVPHNYRISKKVLGLNKFWDFIEKCMKNWKY